MCQGARSGVPGVPGMPGVASARGMRCDSCGFGSGADGTPLLDPEDKERILARRPASGGGRQGTRPGHCGASDRECERSPWAPRAKDGIHLDLSTRYVENFKVHAGKETFPLAGQVRVVSAYRIWEDIEPL